ncbi:VOC family protein [Streptomyces sp. TRM64462]|uniref:VOC family protein n=1 Tax=Streptomyces sp. TRM64462 TaxID=2741726 RepID=UPI001586CE2C|nr:VOC family protein [Streptomyces sp. TRM64462]
MATKPIPEEYPRLTPYLYVDGAAAAIDFYTSVFGATERIRFPTPDGKLGHAELQIGNSVLMLADEFPEMGAVGPKKVGGSPLSIMVYVEDVDAAVERAVSLGAKVLQPVENKFYGDRSGQIEDPYGHRWDVSTHVEDIPPDEMARRAEEMMSGA